MNAIRSLGVAVLILALAAPVSARTSIRDEGQYPVRVLVDPTVLPLPLDLPSLGPGLYAGTLTIRRDGPEVRVRFQGTEEGTGDPVTIQGRFASSWEGIVLESVPFDGRAVPDVVTSVDAASLLVLKINGVGRVDGFTAQVVAEIGPGPALERWTVR